MTLTHCRNCNTYLGQPAGHFCPKCGQETAEHPPTFWEFVHEFITHYVALEGKLWLTLKKLLFNPGDLTHEYRAGRRQRYVSPLRLYITASFLFFLMVKVAGFGAVGGLSGLQFGVQMQDPKHKVTESSPRSTAQTKKMAVHMECSADEALCLSIKERLTKKYGAMADKDVVQTVYSGVMSNLPYALFVLMPLFALLTKLAYAKRGLYFGEHVVYALHVHAFTFFALLLAALLPKSIADALLVLTAIYYFFALKRFFGGRWWPTALRFGFIGGSYMLLIVSVTAAVVFLVLLA